MLKTPLGRHGERKFEENNIITEPSSSAVWRKWRHDDLTAHAWSWFGSRQCSLDYLIWDYLFRAFGDSFEDFELRGQIFYLVSSTWGDFLYVFLGICLNIKWRVLVMLPYEVPARPRHVADFPWCSAIPGKFGLIRTFFRPFRVFFLVAEPKEIFLKVRNAFTKWFFFKWRYMVCPYVIYRFSLSLSRTRLALTY